MRGLDAIDVATACALDGLAFDLDDTVLEHGALPERAYSALFRMREAGLRLAAVTGRPAGWGELAARQWPIDLAVSENGAIAHARRDGRLHCFDRLDEAARAARRQRLAELVTALRREFPALVDADDVALRITDHTFDVGEHERAPEALVDAVMQRARALGARCMRSSVHLHVSFDGDDKASGSVRALGTHFGTDPALALARWAFVGDSENDASCFSAFAHTVGVANLRGRFSRPPRFRTRGARSAGFVELAERLVALRGEGAGGAL